VCKCWVKINVLLSSDETNKVTLFTCDLSNYVVEYIICEREKYKTNRSSCGARLTITLSQAFIYHHVTSLDTVFLTLEGYH